MGAIQTSLNAAETCALRELKQTLPTIAPGAEIILYGSKARGDSEEFSDIDLLVLVETPVDRRLKEAIIGIAYEIELKHDIVFGLLIENKDFWNSPLAVAMPLHQNVDREGIRL